MNVNFRTMIYHLKDLLTEERLKMLQDFIDKYGDDVAEILNSLSEHVKKNTNILCEVISTDRLDADTLKNILRKTMTPKSYYVAALDLGRNKNDQLEIFLQHLDSNKKAVDMNKVYCVRCDMKSDELKKAFGKKNMLLINL
mgnify:CR=1 FL=1